MSDLINRVNTNMLNKVLERLKAATPDQQGEVVQAAALQLAYAGLITSATAARVVCMVAAEAYESAAVHLVPTEPVPNLRSGQWWWRIESWPHDHSAHVAYENRDSGIIEAGAKADTPALALAIAAVDVWMQARDEV